MAKTINLITGAIKNWYLLLIAGLIFLVAGIYAMVSPSADYAAIAYIFSIAFLLVGLGEIHFAITNTKTMSNWGWILALGILTAIIGGIMLSDARIPMTILPFFVSLLLLVRSISIISYAYDMKGYGILDWGNFLIIGALAFILSLVLLFNPIFASISIVFVTSIVVMILGGALIYVSLRLRKIKNFPKDVEKNIRHQISDLQKEVKSALQGIRKSVENIGK